MAVSNIKAVFPCDIKKVWETVTSLENYKWRSDLSRIVILNEKHFVKAFLKKQQAQYVTDLRRVLV